MVELKGKERRVAVKLVRVAKCVESAVSKASAVH